MDEIVDLKVKADKIAYKSVNVAALNCVASLRTCAYISGKMDLLMSRVDATQFDCCANLHYPSLHLPKLVGVVRVTNNYSV